MKNIIVIVGGLISVIAIFFVLYSANSEIDETMVSLDDIKSIEKKSVESANIVYEETQQSGIQSQTVQLSAAEEVEEEVPVDPTVKYQTKDVSKKYAIQLIDEAETEIISHDRIDMTGTIDGKKFKIKVPVDLLDRDVKLKMINIKTNETQMIDLPFVADLATERFPPTLSIDFKDAQNYDTHYVDPSAMPFP